MDSDKYLEGQSMQRPSLFESDSFIYWKNRFETYVKLKDLDLWHVITNGDFQPIIQNPETKLDEVIPFEKQTDDLKKRLAKNNEAKMVIYNTLPRKYQVKDNKIDLLVQQYKQFVISEDESIDNAFARFNTIITSLKALYEGYSSKNYVRKFLRALHPKWRAKVTAIEESKDLTSLSLDELIGNLKAKKESMMKSGFELPVLKTKSYAMAVRDFKKFIEVESDSGDKDDEKVKDETCLVAHASSEICLGVDLEPNEWIKDSGCSKHMMGNRKLFSTYKAYNRGNVVFGSNLRGNIIGKAYASHKAKNLSSKRLVCIILLHMDLFGPSAVRSYGGNRYTLVIVDDYSRYTWTRFLKDKTEAFDQFEIFSKKIQNQLGCTIVSIRTDHGREFDNEVQFGEFCDANGITHNFSAPRTPQSNGVVERKNRTLQEMSRTMLNEQSLPQKFWVNAVYTINQIYFNRILIRVILGKTPYEILRGRKPTLDYFRVFGSKCFILNTKDYLTKFDPKSYEGVFLGYSQNSKAYIILNKHTRKIEESLNVTFDETPPPAKTSPLVDDDLDEEEAIREIEKKNLENNVEDETLEIDEVVNIKESRNHPLENVIGNLNQRTLRSQAQNQSNFYCFILPLNAKNENECLGDERTKWVFRNKLDENGVVSRNKARLVAQGYNQQEGIDYDETYAPVARLESIRILLAYACALDFKLFQMDVTITFPERIINEEYIKEMLKKFGLEDSKPMKTPMSSDTKLTKDEECESVDSTKYRGMIGSLLYLTASRPDIMFSVCLCARFQEAPKTSHLEAVKRIFRYIKGTTHLGLWYPKGTGIETVVYADSDHAGDYKQTALAISTTEAEYVSAGKACQQALWMKQALIDYDVRLDDVPIMCDNKGAIDLSKNPVQHSRTKHIEIRHHFLRDNVQKGHISIEKVPSVNNIADILTKPLKRESFNYLRLGLGMMEHIP
ncbi:retrovirus-related pol polyprotein from transposon TNT 1-94 [Tanacetum coccineum]